MDGYALWSIETDLVRREAHIRFAPLVEGHPDVGGAIEHVTLRNEPEPAEPPELAPPPPAPLADAPDDEHGAHAIAMQDWLVLRRRHAHAVLKYDQAVRAGKGWDEWMADGRPDHVKAEEHYRKAKGL